MNGQCCSVGRAPHGLAGLRIFTKPRTTAEPGLNGPGSLPAGAPAPPSALSKVTAAILSAAMLVLVPKCPLCLAAWLTAATGLSFSAAGAAWIRGSIALLWVTALTLMIGGYFAGATSGGRRLRTGAGAFPEE